MNKQYLSLAIIATSLIWTTDANAQSTTRGGSGSRNFGVAQPAVETTFSAPVADTGISVCTDSSRWPCSGTCQFTTGNPNVACPKFRAFNYQNLAFRGYAAMRDSFHPNKLYAYGRSGIDAARVDQWNRVRASQTPWHGQYNYWQYNAPTAVVLPPTASYQTVYNWGVGGTQSLPINHQFGSASIGAAAGGNISHQFLSPPHQPSSTSQLGVYSVRAPWSHIR